MAGILFIGIDVSGAKNVVCTMTQEGTERLRCTVVKDRPGAEELVQRVIRILTSSTWIRWSSAWRPPGCLRGICGGT